MSSLAWRWEARCPNPALGFVIYQFPFRVLLGIFLGVSGLSGGCAARPDLVKLQQEVKHEKQQRIQRQEELRKDAGVTREQLQRDRAELRVQLNQQHRGFMELQAALAEAMRQELGDTSTALYAELSEVRALAAELRVTLSTVREVELGGVIGKTEEIQKSVEDFRLRLDAESKTLDDFGYVLGKRIGELEKHREWVETHTSGLIEKHAADVEAMTASLNAQRDSLAGFEAALGKLGNDLAVQVITQVRQQDDRIQALSAQVQRMQGWVETRTEELAEQDATDMAMTTLRLEELRKSLAGFKGALANLGEQLSAQLVEEGSRQGEHVQALAAQVQRMEGWVEMRTQILEEKQTVE
ncbi:MAG TPA: hypothetical protein EYN74_05845 [Nitrospirales bacterium]|nr:hypothetical protein [Nitrospirales bacterium]